MKLKELREQHSLTQKEVAEILGVSLKTYKNYESEQSKIKITKIVVLAKYYNISSDYILGLKDEMKKLH